MKLPTVMPGLNSGTPVSEKLSLASSGETQPASLLKAENPRERDRFESGPRFGQTTPFSRMSDAEKGDVHALGERYKQFLGQAVCSPLTAKTIIEEAEKRGFREYPGPFTSVAMPGDKFYINNNYESVALVVIGKQNPVQSGFNIVAAHMDSPQLELKQPEALDTAGGVARLKTKTRGGGIWGHWFNRPLGIAGRVYEPVLGPDGKPVLDKKTRLPLQKLRFVKLDQPSVAIAQEPIHFNRQLNKGREIHPEEDLTPVAAVENGADGSGVGEHARAALKANGVDLNLAKRSELYLYPSTPPQDAGVDGSMVIGAGQDDRAMCFAAMDAIFEAAEATAKNPPDKTGMALFFDNEETGSLGAGGARGRWLESVAGKIMSLQTLPSAKSDTFRREEALDKSVIFSADVAHGYLPQQARYHDRQNHAKLGYGPVVKGDSDGSYATTAQGAALTEDIAKRAGVPVQFLSTNQDVPCGTTIGPMIGSNTNALTIDIGAPLYSMHSPGEIASKADIYHTKKLFSAFYRSV